MAIGWIKLHRKIQECDLWLDREPFDRRSAWIDLLLMANHEDKTIIFKGKPMVIKAGQRLTSLYKLADRWQWSRERVRRYLDLLESLNMITRDSDNNKTIVTIVNYGFYQDYRTTDNTTGNTTDKATDNTQTRMIKNDKNEKKNIYGEYKHVKLTDHELEKLKADYGQDITQASITFLDEYIEMKGYKAKSHYLCIRKWVIDAVKEKRPKQKGTFTSIEKHDEWDSAFFESLVDN